MKQISLDEMTPCQRELTTEKLKRIEDNVSWHKEKTLKGKYFPEQAGFCYDNIGSWFALHKENNLAITCICYVGKGIMLWYSSDEGSYFYDCSKQ
jgi:hypothetical protein